MISDLLPGSLSGCILSLLEGAGCVNGLDEPAVGRVPRVSIQGTGNREQGSGVREQGTEIKERRSGVGAIRFDGTGSVCRGAKVTFCAELASQFGRGEVAGSKAPDQNNFAV